MPNLIMSTVAGIFWISICLLEDHLVLEKFFNKIMGSFKSPPKNPYKNPEEMDEDVRAESDRVILMSDNELKHGNLVLKNLTKYYGRKIAVNQLNLGVNHGECFGLLGGFLFCNLYDEFLC